MSRSGRGRLRAELRVAQAQASATSDLLQLRRIDRDERFVDGVVAAGEIAEARRDHFAMDVARAYARRQTTTEGERRG